MNIITIAIHGHHPPTFKATSVWVEAFLKEKVFGKTLAKSWVLFRNIRVVLGGEHPDHRAEKSRFQAT